jgi:transposase
MVIVLDNASFHKSAKVAELLQSVNCRIIFLPPYSPDFNPIEHWWTAVKNSIRKAALNCKNFFDAAVLSLENFLGLSA